MKKRSRLTLWAACLLMSAACSTPGEPEPPAAPLAEPVEVPAVGSTAEQPQLFLMPDGALMLSWTARGDEGVDLYLAREDGDGFTAGVRINTVPGSVNRITIDEMRPAIATGPDDALAVAWTDSDFDIQLAISGDGGQTFDAPIRINQDEGDALQEFPALAFDADGGLHAVWLDPRFADGPIEEPADLFYAHIQNGAVTERNLTADQASSVCGCCLPNLQIDGQNIQVTFRNTTDDGYRDPFQIHGTTAGDFGEPTPVTAPVWRIDACPVAGPVAYGANVLWLDGSTGVRRLLESQGPGTEPKVVLEDTDEWFIDYPPRRIPGNGAESLLLLPSVPAYVLGHNGAEWDVVIDDLPGWATSAAAVNGELVVAGSSSGRFVLLRRPLP